MNKHKKNFASLIILLMIMLDVLVWRSILFRESDGGLRLYFFDVGQGDSQMINLPDNIKVLIDGGSGGDISEALSQNLLPGDRYIDLVVMTHPQLDHFGGLIEVLNNYEVGAFIANGRKGQSSAYRNLVDTISDKKIPYLALAEGDRIKYKDYVFEIISPSFHDLLSDELNDGGLVIMFQAPDLRVLYTGDMGLNIEGPLIKRYDLSADILKVGHHGSKYSSSGGFVSAVHPRVSVIEVGKNSYGHPAKEVLDRLTQAGSLIYRTDKEGTIKILFDAGKLNIYN